MKTRLYNIYGTICGVIVAALVLLSFLLPAEERTAVSAGPSPLPHSIASQFTP